MSTSILSRISENTNPFSTTMTVDARFAGGTLTVDTEHIDWIGQTLVQVEIPGANPLALRPHEARDLAAALLAVAAFIDEEAAA